MCVTAKDPLFCVMCACSKDALAWEIKTVVQNKSIHVVLQLFQPQLESWFERRRGQITLC